MDILEAPGDGGGGDEATLKPLVTCEEVEAEVCLKLMTTEEEVGAILILKVPGNGGGGGRSRIFEAPGKGGGDWDILTAPVNGVEGGGGLWFKPLATEEKGWGYP